MAAGSSLPARPYADPLSGARYLLIGDGEPTSVSLAALTATTRQLTARQTGHRSLLLVTAAGEAGPASLGWIVAARYLAIATAGLPACEPAGFLVRPYAPADAAFVTPVLAASVREALRAIGEPDGSAGLPRRVARFLTRSDVQGVLAENGSLCGYLLYRLAGGNHLEIIDFDAVNRAELPELIPVLLSDLARRFPGFTLEASVTGDGDRARAIARQRVAQGWQHSATLWKKASCWPR